MSQKIKSLGLLLTVILAGSFTSTWGWVVNLACTSKNMPLETIHFSPHSLVTSQPVQLTLTSQVGGTIHYTLNGSLPQVNAPAYNQPILIDKPTLLRAQVFDEAGEPLGDSYTQSYIIAAYQQTIPVISIAIDPVSLIWLHDYPEEHDQNVEQPITLEYFAPGGQVQFNVKAGLRIHGNRDQLYGPKKSYQISFSQEYGGPGQLDYSLFGDTPVTSFDKLVLRAVSNETSPALSSARSTTAQTYFSKFIGDQVVRNLHRDMGQPVAHGRWVLLYLNGQFRGLYNLTEVVDLSYFRSYSDQDAEWDVISQETDQTAPGEWVKREITVTGQAEGWLATQNWLNNADFTNPANITTLEATVDLENLFSVLFLQVYVQNYDWPGQNWMVYRRRDAQATASEARWRMMIWNTEDSFGSGSVGFKTDANILEQIYHADENITRLAKPLSDNETLRQRFVQRVREYLGMENLDNRPPGEVGQLSKERIKTEILNQATIVRPFIEMETQQWASHLNVKVFDQNVAAALLFVDERQDMILHHLDMK